VIVLVDNKSNSIPKVARVFNSDVESIDMLNLEKINDALILDHLSYSPTGLIILSGRTISNTEIEILHSTEVLGKTKSKENGAWKFILRRNDYLNDAISIKTIINGETLLLTYDQDEIKKRFKKTNFDFYDDRIIVEKGNSLWRIARKTLGGGVFYTEIYKNNLAKIKNPNLIYPGQVFNIPFKRNK
jgi:nucleoid-associated protein YgaU